MILAHAAKMCCKSGDGLGAQQPLLEMALSLAVEALGRAAFGGVREGRAHEGLLEVYDGRPGGIARKNLVQIVREEGTARAERHRKVLKKDLRVDKGHA